MLLWCPDLPLGAPTTTPKRRPPRSVATAGTRQARPQKRAPSTVLSLRGIFVAATAAPRWSTRTVPRVATRGWAVRRLQARPASIIRAACRGLPPAASKGPPRDARESRASFGPRRTARQDSGRAGSEDVARSRTARRAAARSVRASSFAALQESRAVEAMRARNDGVVKAAKPAWARCSPVGRRKTGVASGEILTVSHLRIGSISLQTWNIGPHRSAGWFHVSSSTKGCAVGFHAPAVRIEPLFLPTVHFSWAKFSAHARARVHPCAMCERKHESLWMLAPDDYTHGKSNRGSSWIDPTTARV